jgi:opacity protein-like surface antigen
MRKFLFAAMISLSALAATPAAAQAYEGTPPPPEGYYDEGYSGPDEWAASDEAQAYEGQAEVTLSYSEGYDRPGYQGQRRYQPGDYYQGGGVAMNAPPPRRYRDRRPRRCGNTGAILGGIAGALLGGEIGRGNHRYSRRSGTGTVIGAGVGALIGNDIDRQNCYGR